MGTKMFDSLMMQGHIVLDGDKLTLSETGAAFASSFKIDLDTLNRARAPLCRECLDWSERRSHLAGSLGRAFLTRFEAVSWVKRDQKSRVLTFSPIGAKSFHQLFAIGGTSKQPAIGAFAAINEL